MAELLDVSFANKPKTLRKEDIALERGGFSIGYGIGQLKVRWTTLLALRAVDPWPNFEVQLRDHSASWRGMFKPRFATEAEDIEAEVEALFAHVGKDLPTRTHRGWLDEPDCQWEPVNAFPDGKTRSATAGAYRSAAERPVDVLAHRPTSSPFETLLLWLSSGPTRPWRDYARKLAITEDELFSERHDGQACRIALEHLRSRRPRFYDTRDTVYVFGRRLPLILPRREGCEVARLLDARLAKNHPDRYAHLAIEDAY